MLLFFISSHNGGCYPAYLIKCCGNSSVCKKGTWTCHASNRWGRSLLLLPHISFCFCRLLCGRLLIKPVNLEQDLSSIRFCLCWCHQHLKIKNAICSSKWLIGSCTNWMTWSGPTCIRFVFLKIAAFILRSRQKNTLLAFYFRRPQVSASFLHNNIRLCCHGVV